MATEKPYMDLYVLIFIEIMLKRPNFGENFFFI